MKTKLNKALKQKKASTTKQPYTPANKAVFVRLTPEMYRELDKVVEEANNDPRNKWTKITRSSVLRAAVELGLPHYRAGLSNVEPAVESAESESPENHAE